MYLIKTLLDKILSLKTQIDAIRPLNPELNKTLQEKLRIEWTYNSNAIEGNTLTYGETAFFLREGLTSEGKPLKDYLEAKNHSEAVELLYDYINEKRDLSEGLIKELHALLLKGITYTYAKGQDGTIVKKKLNTGTYKTQPNHVLTMSGEIHHYTDPIHVHDEIEKLINWYKQEKKIHVIEKSIIFHYRFVAIHPFDDGNGRLSRILMNLMLMKDGYPPCIIKNIHRKKYIQCLEIADINKDITPFVHFVAEELLSTLIMMKDVFEGNIKEEKYIATNILNKDQRLSLILETINNTPLSISQIHDLLHQIKRPTLKKDLHYLVSQKIIKKKGVGKGVLYWRE